VGNRDLQGDDAHLISVEPGNGARGRPVVVGEVLFDVFPDDDRILGGAPFNVAWHLQAFGLDPLLITRIGDDADGTAVVDAMSSWGMDLSGVQTDAGAPTGEVRVRGERGEPSFEILSDQAYDFLDGAAALDAIEGHDTSLVYHGSLIARSDLSRSAVRTIRGLDGLPAFVDVNLREPWWSKSAVATLLEGVRWVKLNSDELAGLLEVTASDVEFGLDAAVCNFQQRFRIEQVIVTMGSAGASVTTGERFIRRAPPAVPRIVDTVGAGDAFSAVWIAGLIEEWCTEEALVRALSFAADVCTFRGAVTEDRSLYDRHLDSWQET
jgi:fructokinase